MIETCAVVLSRIRLHLFVGVYHQAVRIRRLDEGKMMMMMGTHQRFSVGKRFRIVRFKLAGRFLFVFSNETECNLQCHVCISLRTCYLVFLLCLVETIFKPTQFEPTQKTIPSRRQNQLCQNSNHQM